VLDRNQRERLRRRYRPAQVRLLFIGESPPASGRFFYQADSGLYRAMRETFQRVVPALPDESFLEFFQASGCYLVDLCLDPVDRLDRSARQSACRAGEAALAKAIVQLQPAAIVTLVRSIESNALRAASDATWHGTMLHLPYPGRWSHLKQTFVERLVPIIGGLTSGR